MFPNKGREGGGQVSEQKSLRLPKAFVRTEDRANTFKTGDANFIHRTSLEQRRNIHDHCKEFPKEEVVFSGQTIKQTFEDVSLDLTNAAKCIHVILILMTWLLLHLFA